MELPEFNPDMEYEEDESPILPEFNPDAEYTDAVEYYPPIKTDLEVEKEFIQKRSEVAIKAAEKIEDKELKELKLLDIEKKKREAEKEAIEKSFENIDLSKEAISRTINAAEVGNKLELDEYGKPVEQGLKTPAISPEFALGGIFTKLGAVSSVVGDIGAEIAVKGFDAITDKLTPELKKENPTAYALLSMIPAIAGGKIADVSTTGVLKEVEALAEDPVSITRNILKGKASDKQSYDYLVSKTGETDESISEALNKYAHATNKSLMGLTEQDKINAILTNTKGGKSFKIMAEIYNEQTLGSLNKMEESISNAVKNATADGSFELPTSQLRDYISKSGEMFEDAKNVLLDNYNETIKVDPEQVKNLEDTLKQSSSTTDDIAMVKKIIGFMKNPEGTSVEQMLTAKMDLNKLNLKSTKGFKAGEVGQLMDDMVEDAVGEDVFGVWKEVNKRYATQALMKKDNPLGKLLLEGSTGNKSASKSSSEIAKGLLNMSNKGYDTFNFVRQALGEEATSLIEKKIVNLAFSKDTDMSKAVEKISEFDFATVEGRNLQQEVNRLSGLVSDKDAKNLLGNLLGQNTSSTGWSDNILSKVKYNVIGQVWDSISRRLPSGKQERVLSNIGDAIKSNKYIDDINIKKGEAFEELFQKEQSEMQKRIDDLKTKGKSKTNTENKELADKIKLSKQIDKALSNKAKVSTSRKIQETSKKDKSYIVKPKEGKAPRATRQHMSSVKDDIADKTKEIARLEQELKIFSNPKKTKATSSKRKEMVTESGVKLKKAKAELLSLKRKLPK